MRIHTLLLCVVALSLPLVAHGDNNSDVNTLKEQQAHTQSVYGGLGIQFNMVDGAMKVITPIKDGPAYYAGIKSGDFIIKLDDIPLKGMTPNDVINLIRDKLGRNVIASIIRKDEPNPLEFKIVRSIITPPSAPTVANPFNFGETNCLTFAESFVLGNFRQKAVFWPDTTNMSLSDVLQYAKSRIPDICEELVRNEVLHVYEAQYPSNHKACINFDANTREQLRQYFIRYDDSRDSISPEQHNLHDKTISACQSNLTPEALVKYGNGSERSIAGMYSKVKAREDQLADDQKALEENKAAEELALAKKHEFEEKLAANIKLARQTKRNFEIKGLNLKFNKRQIISIGGTRVWACSKFKDDPAIEVCTLNPTGKSCISNSLVDPLTGDNVYDIQGQVLYGREKCSNIPIAGMPPEVNKLSTLGGKSVLSINVGFFKGTLFEYQFLIEGISPELKSGLIEKFGEPTVKSDNHLQWLGKDETLELLPNNAEIILYKPSLNKLSKLHRANQIISDKKEAQEKAQRKKNAIAEQKKRDL